MRQYECPDLEISKVLNIYWCHVDVTALLRVHFRPILLTLPLTYKITAALCSTYSIQISLHRCLGNARVRFFSGQMPFLTSNHQCKSTEGNSTAYNKRLHILHSNIKTQKIFAYNVPSSMGAFCLQGSESFIQLYRNTNYVMSAKEIFCIEFITLSAAHYTAMKTD